MHKKLCQILRDAPFLPTAFPTSAEGLCGFARALHEECYPAVEVLARPLNDLFEVFQRICASPERKLIRWGIGTINTASAARQVLELRPDFLVSPAFSRRVLEVCAIAEVPYIPGVSSFQDVQDALDAFEDYGLEVQILKLCPVYHLSAEYVASLCNCFPGIDFCPTGGITGENYLYWKRTPGIVAPMDSGFVPREWIEMQQADAIRARLREIRQLADSITIPKRLIKGHRHDGPTDGNGAQAFRGARLPGEIRVD